MDIFPLFVTLAKAYLPGIHIRIIQNYNQIFSNNKVKILPLNAKQQNYIKSKHIHTIKSQFIHDFLLISSTTQVSEFCSNTVCHCERITEKKEKQTKDTEWNAATAEVSLPLPPSLSLSLLSLPLCLYLAHSLARPPVCLHATGGSPHAGGCRRGNSRVNTNRRVSRAERAAWSCSSKPQIHLHTINNE